MRFFDPTTDFLSLRREIDRAFEAFRGNGGTRNLFLPGRSPRSYPLVNIAEDADHVYAEALAPGLDPDKIEITVVGNQLTITGEKTPPADVKPESYHRNERAAGRFVRTFTLPTEVKSESVEASYKAGVLTISLPKAEAAKPRKIAVAVA